MRLERARGARGTRIQAYGLYCPGTGTGYFPSGPGIVGGVDSIV